MILGTTTRKGLKGGGLLFYRIIFLIAVGYILWLLLDYKNCWIDTPYIDTQCHPVFRNGPGLVPADLGRIFDNLGFEFGYSRARFLARWFEIIDFKFRLWLFNYLPPHPSITFTGLLSLILSPFLLFKLIYNLTRSKKASWIGISLYYVSTGFLPGITVFSLPTRSLTNLLAIYCFYLASKITVIIKDSGYLTRKALMLYLGLIVLLFLTFFADETAWTLYACVPIFFPALFTIKKEEELRWECIYFFWLVFCWL